MSKQNDVKNPPKHKYFVKVSTEVAICRNKSKALLISTARSVNGLTELASEDAFTTEGSCCFRCRLARHVAVVADSSRVKAAILNVEREKNAAFSATDNWQSDCRCPSCVTSLDIVAPDPPKAWYRGVTARSIVNRSHLASVAIQRQYACLGFAHREQRQRVEVARARPISLKNVCGKCEQFGQFDVQMGPQVAKKAHATFVLSEVAT
jgi:hypothetical protein